MIALWSTLLVALLLANRRFLTKRTVQSPFELACRKSDSFPMSKVRWVTPTITCATERKEHTTHLELHLDGLATITCMGEDGLESSNLTLPGSATLRFDDPDIEATGFLDMLRNHPDNVAAIELTKYGQVTTAVTLENNYGFLHTLTTEDVIG